MANNKRVLRSHNPTETRKIKNSKKCSISKKIVQKAKPAKKMIHRSVEESISHPTVKK
jgi:hypothetical protein